MAIVINGSGTITGISVGGLPDDIVDAGTLADDAVGLAQMAAGTDGNVITYDASGNPAVVATGSSGQVLTSAGADAVPTMATLSAGKVLQVVSDHDDARTSSSTDGVEFQSQAITTTGTNKVMIIWNGSVMNDSNHGSIRLYRGGTGGTLLCQISQGWDNNNWPANDNTNYGNQGISFLDSPGGAASYTYSIHAYCGNNAMFWNKNPNDYADNRSHADLTLMEIAG